MSRRRPRIELRVYFLGFLLLCGFGVIAARLWWVQVARGAEYTKRIAGRSEVTVRIPSVRGEIRDRNGIALVQNRASYEVDFYLPEMVRGYRQKPGVVVPRITYTAPVRGMLTYKQDADIVQIVNTSIVPRLLQLDLAKDYNATRLQKHFRNNTEVPFTYLEDVKFDTIAKFSEHDVGLPGVDIAIKPVRQYLYGALAAHLLGYVGAPTDIDKLPDVKKYKFYQPDVEGKSQVELYMDKYLRGTPGVRVMQRNVKGVIEGESRVEQPKPGNNLYLTIDARIQFIAEQALRAVGRGAAVVVDPNNGDILAMASVPSYDPNSFIPSISAKDWATLNDDETDPLMNRAINSYAPGSTFKAVTALGGLRKGLTAGNQFTCSGSVTYGNKAMKCWVVDKRMSPHGSLPLAEAIKVSCNAFFYQYGNAAGIENIDAVGEALGLGEKTDVPLSGESPGILPGPNWLKSVSPTERWSNGYTANVSIGQGSVQASPLQMAMVTATIANGGVSYQPRLIDKVVDQEGKPVLDEAGAPVVPPPGTVRANLRDHRITAAQIEQVRRGMWKVVNDQGGTGKRAQVKGVEVAGKTGTAQFWRETEKGGKIKDNHTWFICFAPYDKPKYAVCTFVQGAKSGGGVSAPIAQKILEETFAIERGYAPPLAALQLAKGSFNPIEEVKYQSVVPAALEADQETAEHSEPPDPEETSSTKKKRKRQVAGVPDIRVDADDRGRVVTLRGRPVRAATPVNESPPDRRSIFQKFFRSKRQSPPASQPPQQQPSRRSPRFP